jgi:hypothetical protein
VKIETPGGIMAPVGGISLYYLGEEKASIRKKSDYILNGTLPADSIIELKFKIPLQRPTKYFLYPNTTFDYRLQTSVGFGRAIKIKDLSVYPEGGTAGVASQQGVLPKGVSVNKRNLAISYVNEKTLSSDEIRKQWTRQGGQITGRSLSYLGTFANSKIKQTSLTTTTTIIGGGWTYTQNYYNLKIPEYKAGIATWKSLIYGIGLSANLHMAVTDIDPAPTADFEPLVGGSFVFIINGNFGYTLGLGKFKTETNYRGFALDLTYKPSIVASYAEGYSSTQMNFKGFGFDISRTSFSAFANSIAPKAKSKFSFLFLPPIKDTPLMISVGYGLVWYR